MRKVIRIHIFKHLKFFKGESVSTDNKKKNRKRTPIVAIGKFHERLDLRKKTGYEVQILKLVGKDEQYVSIETRVLRWKTYQSHIHNEIRQLRGSVNNNIK